MKVAAETGRSSVLPTPRFQPGLALCSGWADFSSKSPRKAPSHAASSALGRIQFRRPRMKEALLLPWPEAGRGAQQVEVTHPVVLPTLSGSGVWTSASSPRPFLATCQGEPSACKVHVTQ